MSKNPDYLKDRIDDQLEWYRDKANTSKKRFHASQIVIIIAGALVPIVNSVPMDDANGIRLISSILGGIILGISGILQLKKYQENWVQYRSTEEVLKKEKFLFLNNAGEYANMDDASKHRLLVERVESIISNQNVNFFVSHSEKKEEG